MKTHAVKCWPTHFQAIVEGRKTFELRRDDRGYDVGHVMQLQEDHPATDTYSGRVRLARIVVVLAEHEGLRAGFKVLGIEVLP